MLLATERVAVRKSAVNLFIIMLLFWLLLLDNFFQQCISFILSLKLLSAKHFTNETLLRIQFRETITF